MSGYPGPESRHPRKTEWARHWRHAALPGVELLRAHYVAHTFPRHSHEGYVIAAVTRGVEEVGLGGGVVRTGAGEVVMINPEEPHSARAGAPEGWVYSTLYPSRSLVAGIAAETGAGRGTPHFTETRVRAPRTAALLHAVHHAAEEGDGLRADSLLREVVAGLLHRHGGPSVRRPPAAGVRTAARARSVLLDRMDGPPTLERLARDLGTSPFALSRAFRAAYGMPPHAWLTNARVRRARELLLSGHKPAEVAVRVGFSDQSHLNRHFTRIVGVPPGVFRSAHTDAGTPSGPHPEPGRTGEGRRERRNVQDEGSPQS
ncbi:AraC family transcriptional regulator [Streptomyces sp. NPDC059740]|uniref:helix-turn-helix transcriptional regulator n=1 Tax=Streptomyces sp. NPDC059740 TaxID=3346926 RepID=UPI003660D9AB